MTRIAADLSVIEHHPLQPFLPPGAELLFLGSFPPGRERWSMDFYYPNLQNDMWRIFGLIFFGAKDHFLRPDKSAFQREAIVDFLTREHIALSDTAQQVIRRRGNASDQFLEIVEPTDFAGLLAQLPNCRRLVTTGQKATETLCKVTKSPEPSVGYCVDFVYEGRALRHYRMPSSSRAYPLPLPQKAAVYARFFEEIGHVIFKGESSREEYDR